MSIDSTKKSSRLLQSRRYTHDSFTDAQEAFTSVLDINSNEIYIDQGLIPSSSLPFSGSGQNGSVYSVGGKQVLKYYYRQKMTKSNLNNEVWFLLNPTGSAAGIGAQLIDPNQQTNFISPKYSIPGLANASAEDNPPGYLAKVFVTANGSSPSPSDQISINNYQFDYKTGVLQFTTAGVAPTNSQYVSITAYQYVGRTLASDIGLAESASYAITASYVEWDGVANKPSGLVSSSQQVVTYISGTTIQPRTVEASQVKISSDTSFVYLSSSMVTNVYDETRVINPAFSTDEFSGISVEYIAQSADSLRTGIVMGSWSGSTLTYTDISNTDVGNTSDLSFNFVKAGSEIRLRAYSSGSAAAPWTIQLLFKLFPNLI